MGYSETPSLGAPSFRKSGGGGEVNLNTFGNFDVSRQGGLVGAWIEEVRGMYLAITKTTDLDDIIMMIDKVLAEDEKDRSLEDEVKVDLKNLRQDVLGKKADLLIGE